MLEANLIKEEISFAMIYCHLRHTKVIPELLNLNVMDFI